MDGPSNTTVFAYYASGKLVAEYSTNIAAAQDAKVSYLTNDPLGSPRITTDALGQLVSRRDFMPFGEEIFGTAARTTAQGYAPDTIRQKFTGYQRDDETSLDFAQARMYANHLGRFTSPDNFVNDTHTGDPRSWNPYVYVRNNPLLFIDPSGEEATVTIETDEKKKTGTIKIKGSIAIWTKDKSLSEDQMKTAAQNIESAIEKGWSGTFEKDGITYTVVTDVTVDTSNWNNEKGAAASGAGNVIEMFDGNKTGEFSQMNPRGILASHDTGRWNIQASLQGTQEPAHEFGHGMGFSHADSGKSLMRQNVDMTRRMVRSDFDQFGREIASHREHSRATEIETRGDRGGWVKKRVGPPQNSRSTRTLTMWNRFGF